MIRLNNREKNQLRAIKFIPDFQIHPIGSVLSVFGDTRVLCSVSVEDRVPGWMKAQNVPGGWITAQYQMLPGATNTRTEREVTKGKLSGRSAEIQRLIGRSLRAVVDLQKIPGMTFHIDCDVIDADGGTRCASITGASLALQIAAKRLIANGKLAENPIKNRVAAVSVGIIDQTPVLDMCYTEDSAAEVDMNVIMTDEGRFVELQGTGEEATFNNEELVQLLDYAKKGLTEIFTCQANVLENL
ncbi:MAG: ribonuclease PH [Lentisphaeria bacterium]